MKREIVVCGRGGGRASPSTDATGASESRVPLDRLNSCANSRFTCNGDTTFQTTFKWCERIAGENGMHSHTHKERQRGGCLRVR
jgi:hypothetical protein